MKIIRPVQVTQAGSLTRNSTATYTDKNGVLQTAPVNTLRIAYDPSNLTNPPFAVIETASANLALYSADFTNAVWSKILGGSGTVPVVTGAAPAAPDGTTTAQRVTFNSGAAATTNFSKVQQVVAMAASTAYTLSVFLKSNTGADQKVLLIGTTATKLVTVTSSWTRFSLSDVANGSAIIGIGLVGDSSSAITADILAWGAQVEQGGYTSYIPTTGASVTRAADVVATNGLLYSNVPEADYAVWDATKIYVTGDRILDVTAHKIYESVTGKTATATLTVASPCIVTLKDSTGAAYVPAAGTPIKFSTTGTLPTGLTAGTLYYVVNPSGSSFSVSATSGGTAINTTGSQTGTHTASASMNFNQAAPNTTYWLDAGYDNRWEMFDQSITSQTTAAGEIVVAFAPGQRLDSVVGLNCGAASATISFTDIGSGSVVYSAIVGLVSNSGIQDWYSYMFEPIVQISEFVIDNVPLGISTNAIITVALKIPSGNAAIGGLVFGLARDIGITEWGAKVSTVDYSVKTKDAFGNYVITPRAFSKKGDFTVQVPTGSVDYLQNMLAQFRATPVVYIGSNSGDRTQFNSTIIYGFYKDFTIDIAYSAFSACSLSVEGLT
jgi:hypothetical protein